MSHTDVELLSQETNETEIERLNVYACLTLK